MSVKTAPINKFISFSLLQSKKNYLRVSSESSLGDIDTTVKTAVTTSSTSANITGNSTVCDESKNLTDVMGMINGTFHELTVALNDHVDLLTEHEKKFYRKSR